MISSRQELLVALRGQPRELAANSNASQREAASWTQPPHPPFISEDAFDPTDELPWVEKLLQLAACVTEIHRFSRRLLDARSAAISAAARASLAAALPASHSTSATAPYSIAGATGGITSVSESGRDASHRVLAGAAGGASGLQCALATCVEEEALLPYTHEVDRLFSSPLPVRTIWAKLSVYEQLLTGLVRVTSAIEQGNITGAHLLRYLEQESSFGPIILSIALDVCIRHCQRVWVGQLAHWMAFGALPPDGGAEFFISRAAPAAPPAPGPGAVVESRAERTNGIVFWDEYSINEVGRMDVWGGRMGVCGADGDVRAQLPPDFAPETAEAALFVGRAMLLLQEAGRRSESELSGRGSGSSRQRKHEADVKRILDSVLALRVSVSRDRMHEADVKRILDSVLALRVSGLQRKGGACGAAGMACRKQTWREYSTVCSLCGPATIHRPAQQEPPMEGRTKHAWDEQRVHEVVEAARKRAAHRLWQLVVRESDLFGHLHAVHYFLLGGGGAFMQSVWQSLREVLAQPDVRARVANDKLQLAVEKASACIGEEATLKYFRTFSFKFIPPDLTRPQLSLQPSAQPSAQPVAAFLFRLRRVALELQLAWLLLCKVRAEGARMRGLPEKGPRGMVAGRGEGVRGGEGGFRGAGVGGVQGKGRGEAVGSGRGEEEGQMKRTWSLPAGSGEAVRSGGVDAGPATASAAGAAGAAGFTRSTSVAAGSVGGAGSGRGGSSGVVRTSLGERKEHLMLCMMLKEMLQIVTSLQTYLHADVVEVEWAAFLASIRANPDFSFLLAAHDRFLASLERHVMLGNTHFTRPLHSLLVLAMKLCRRLHHSAPLPLPLLQDMRKELDAKACALYLSVGMLHHSVSTPQVHKLLTQINFNGYYSLSTS
ncbi:unnamed protein product [Closterium sp. NIES-65]|nr:unnamed protein product [Closterium sp. NIES-65]